MQVGRMKNEDEALNYVSRRLGEVKKILDDIAHNTGVVYVCLSSEVVEMFGKFGDTMVASLIDTMRVIPDRIELANGAIEFARKQEKENGGFDEPGISDGHTEDDR